MAGPTLRSARSARATGPAGATGAAGITGCVRRMNASRSRPTVVACRPGRWRSGSGVGRTGTHAQCGGAQSAGDSDPPE